MIYKLKPLEWKPIGEIGEYRAMGMTHCYFIRNEHNRKRLNCVCLNGCNSTHVADFDTVAECQVEAEKHNKLNAVKLLEPVNEPISQRDRIIQAVNTLTDICHGASRKAGWWTDITTGQPLKRNKGEMLMLMVSELAEAMEADRKSLNDDHLPQYDGLSVELADCLVRICDFVGGFGLKTAEAMADKIEYNANRADHKIENRLKDNGKKY